MLMLSPLNERFSKLTANTISLVVVSRLIRE